MTAASSLLSRLDRIARTDAPVRRLVAFRMLVGLFATIYTLVRAPYLASASHDSVSFAPVGICALLLRSALPVWVMWLVVGLAIVSGVLFTVGRHVRVAGPVWFAALFFSMTYASSWGKILHSENLLVLHAGILALVFALTTTSSLAPQQMSLSPKSARLALRAMSVVTVLTYFVAGITKLRSGGAGWISGEALGDWLAWDALRKIELGSLHSPLAPLLASSPALLQMLALYTLIVELGAPLALFSRRVALGWVVLAWLFHAGILATMAIGFFYPLSAIAFGSMLPIERLPIIRRFLPPDAPRVDSGADESNRDVDDDPLRSSTPSLFH